MSAMSHLIEKFEKVISIVGSVLMTLQNIKSLHLPDDIRSPTYPTMYSYTTAVPYAEFEDLKSKFREMSAALKAYKKQKAEGKW
jgi:hypothetical protein